MQIYNLFPRIAGRFDEWTPHLQRAAGMGFDWVFVNPIQKLGGSASLYSISDYFAINPAFLDPKSKKTPETQVRSMVAEAEGLGMHMMVDLVINHCAADSKLIRRHPDWFRWDQGKIANPFCVEEDGTKVVWRDLAQFDHAGSRDAEGLLQYCGDVVEYLAGLGFRGFRCDAAYKIPQSFWRRLIGRIKDRQPDVVFVAETLGCSPDQTRQTAEAGFDYLFNSSKWWDFSSSWLLEQHEQTRGMAPSISFPESHDTERLFKETGRNVDAQKQRYLFAALFSAGIMMPVGYEYGFQNRLHVVHSRADQWEQPAVDLTRFIAQVNDIKQQHSIFKEECVTRQLDHPNPAILMLRKESTQGAGEALLVFNKDPINRQSFYTDSLYHHVSTARLVDVSPEWPLDYLPTPFEFELTPGMARVMVTDS